MPKKVIALGGGSGSVTATAGALTSNSVVLGAGATDTKVVAGFTTDGSKELDIGAVGVGNGVLGLKGTTSGTATLTAPAVAGTTTNPIAVSNAITLPDGAVGTPSIAWASQTNTGLWNNGNSIAWSVTGTVRGNLGNGTFSVGNGAQFLVSGNKIATYNSIATVDNGVPSEIATAARDQTGLTAALAATTICTPAATGRFRVSVYAKVTTPASVSSVLGGTTGFTLTYTDGTDSVAQSVIMAMDTAAGGIGISAAGNSTTTMLTGTTFIYAKTGVPIQLAVDYSSSGTAMAYCIRASVEAM